MNYNVNFRSYDCVFRDKIVLCTTQFLIGHRRVALLSYMNSVFSQSYMYFYEAGQV